MYEMHFPSNNNRLKILFSFPSNQIEHICGNYFLRKQTEKMKKKNAHYNEEYEVTSEGREI